MTTELPPKLREKRDANAIEHIRGYNGAGWSYEMGFDACAVVLLPVIREMMEALDEAEYDLSHALLDDEPKFDDINDARKVLVKALAQVKEKLGEL